VARRKRIDESKSRHHDIGFKRLEKGSFRFPTVSAAVAPEGVEVKAAEPCP